MQLSTLLSACRTTIVLVAVLASASAAWAQTVTDARRVEFTPSAEHNAVDDNGVAVLTRYSLQVFLAGGATALQTVDLGKPAPQTDGLIRLDFVSLLPTPLSNGVLYETVVESVGPAGRSASLRSNTFSFTVPCTWSISPTSQSFAAAGGTGTNAVTTAAGCAWTATSNNIWIAVTAGTSGSASGTVSYTVSANTLATPRTGTVTIAGSTLTITQAAACVYTISPVSQAVPATGGTGTVAVTTTTGCNWTGTSGAAWVTITSGATGSGNGGVGFTAAANVTTVGRSATLTIAGKTFTVTQVAASCTFTVTPRTISATQPGSTGSIAVTTVSGCAWLASTPVNWITLTGSGPGTGATAYTIAANTGTLTRSATLIVAGLTVVVTQAPVTLPASPVNVRVIR
jgi:hypothetical protein